MQTELHKPEMIVIAGPNGSGKTSVTRKLLHHEWTEGTLYINPDEIAQNIFGDWNSPDAVYKAAKYSESLRESCLKDKKSFVFETVMSSPEKVDFIIRAKEAGFFIRLFFISTDHPSINASRIAKRVMKGGHDVPIKKIVSRYYKSIANCRIVSSIVDRLYVYDNSVEESDAVLQYRLSSGKLVKCYVNNIHQWAKNILP